MPTADAKSLIPGMATVSAQATDANGNVSKLATETFTFTTAGSANGDVHLTTFDGLRYDFQATGQFVLAESTNAADPFQVQVQETAWNNFTSVTTKVAVEVGDNILTFKQDGSVYLNGVLDSSDASDLTGGKLVRLSPDAEEVQWDGGEDLFVSKSRNGFINLVMTLPDTDGANSVQGLLGRNSGQANDFSLPDGTVIAQPLSSKELKGFYADAWRVTEADSLFTGVVSAPAATSNGSAAIMSSGLNATRTNLSNGGYEISTTGIVGEPYDSSNDFYDAGGHIESGIVLRERQGLRNRELERRRLRSQ